MSKYLIAPSILSADFSRLGEEIVSVVKAGADLIHFDVMDNHFVPNLTIGPIVCQSVRPITSVPIDVHLMIQPVDPIIPAFARAGANIISFHPEASLNIDKTVDLIKRNGCEVGIVLNPSTPVNYLNPLMDKIDLILVMSVNPGFGGQSFIKETLSKISYVRKMIDSSGKNIKLEVDGGVKIENIAEIASAGCDTFVAGSAIFKNSCYKSVIKEMRNRLSNVARIIKEK
tara:strand:- start:46 stop:732 length:687 start_codon:yes stop_codon:yes gene_type:complete